MIKAYLLKGVDTDSANLTIDKIAYIPGYFSIIHRKTNRTSIRESWDATMNYGLRGRDDLPRGLEFFQYVVDNNVVGGYNDSIEYAGELELPILEEDLKEAREVGTLGALINSLTEYLDNQEINNRIYSPEEISSLEHTEEISYSDTL